MSRDDCLQVGKRGVYHLRVDNQRGPLSVVLAVVKSHSAFDTIRAYPHIEIHQVQQKGPEVLEGFSSLGMVLLQICSRSYKSIGASLLHLSFCPSLSAPLLGSRGDGRASLYLWAQAEGTPYSANWHYSLLLNGEAGGD